MSHHTATAELIDALAERYTVTAEIGHGGMASVYRARDRKHERDVAIKVLDAELGAAVGTDRFLTEIRTTANLQHPHILPLFDSGVAAGRVYYVMPLLDGETVRARIEREGQLQIVEAIRIACEVADALSYAHAHGIVHRDIKPENILLQGGHALVADFGIALGESTAGGERLTQSGYSVGTPAYMSPEQAAAERKLDGRSDQYALAAVLYEMLAGEPPFTGPNAASIMVRQMAERAPRLASRRPSVPVWVSAAVERALEKVPGDRWPNVAEFSRALLQVPTISGAEPAAVLVPRGVAGRRLFPWAMLALGAAASAVIMPRIGGRFVPKNSMVVKGNVDVPGNWTITLPDSLPFVAGMNGLAVLVRSLTMSGDGRLAAYSTQQDGLSSLVRIRTDVGEVARIPGTSGAIMPTMSPDGRSIAFLVGSEFRRVTFDDGALSRLGVAKLTTQLSWRGNDTLVFGSWGACLRAMTLSAAEPTQFPRGQCVIAGEMMQVPDVTHTQFVATEDRHIGWIDANRGMLTLLSRARMSDTTDPGTRLRGEYPFLADSGLLMFLRDSRLFAARYDAKSARVLTEALPVLTNIRREQSGGATQLAYSANGTLLWVDGPDFNLSRFVWVGVNGRVQDTIAVPAAYVRSYAISASGRRLAYATEEAGGRIMLRIADLQRTVIDSAKFTGWVPINWISDSVLSVVTNVPTPRGNRYAMVRIDGAHFVLDTTSNAYQSESPDGSYRCVDGDLWPAAAPANRIHFDVGASWCTFSPDSRMIAWRTDEGLFVAPANERMLAGRRRIDNSASDEPHWSRDSRQVYFRGGNGTWGVINVPADLAAPVLPGHELFRGLYGQAIASWALGADGRFLLLKGPPLTTVHTLRVITNFPRFVREKLKAAGQ